MPVSRSELDEQLAELEALVPDLLRDRDSFPRRFEDRVEVLLSGLSQAEQAYALSRLEGIVDRSGFHR